MNKKISLKDIAAQAGVSVALVSYVLNNQKQGRINQETAQRIRDIAQALHYRTNQVAKSLKTKKTNTIGLILADIANPFSSSLARIIEDEADKNGYIVIFGSSDENEQKFQRLVDTFLTKQVDGLILSPPEGSEEQIKYLLKQQIPFVLLDRYFPDLKTNYVVLDNFGASAMAVEHLINTGRKRIGMITYKTTLEHLLQREKGFAVTMKSYKTGFEKSWIKRIGTDHFEKHLDIALTGFLEAEKRFDALILGSNTIASYVLRRINTLPVKVPRDIAILSFDQAEILDLFYAPVTHIRQPLREMGQLATRVLLDNLEKQSLITQMEMKAELIIQQSTLGGNFQSLKKGERQTGK